MKHDFEILTFAVGARVARNAGTKVSRGTIGTRSLIKAWIDSTEI